MHKAVNIRISSRLRARWLRFLSAFSPSLRTAINTFFALFSSIIPQLTASSYSRFSTRFTTLPFSFTATTFSTARSVTVSIFSCNSEIGGNNFTTCRTSSRCSSSLFPYTRSMLSSGSARSSNSGVASFSRPARSHSSTCSPFSRIMLSVAFMTTSAFILFAVTSLPTFSPCSTLPSGSRILAYHLIWPLVVAFISVTRNGTPYTFILGEFLRFLPIFFTLFVYTLEK